MICLCRPYIEKFGDCNLFADGDKLSRYVSNQGDSTDLQKGFCALKEWSDYWLLKLNIKKCNVISLSCSNTVTKYKYSATVGNTIELERCNKVRDMGLIMAALCNRGPLYFCPVVSFFLSSSFFPRLISAATDWMSTILLHMAWP